MLRYRFASLLAVALFAATLAACEEQEVSDLGHEATKEAVQSGDRNAFEPYKGTKVRWSGTITEAVVRRGDDYVEEAHLYVDLDGASGGDADPDITLGISPDQARELNAGTPITFVAVLREIALGEASPMIRAELVEIEP